jgi:hypothetical protein
LSRRKPIPRIQISMRLLVTFAAMAALSVVAAAFELKPKSLAAFERYVQLTEARMNTEIAGTAPFLWLDRQTEKERAKAWGTLKKGEVVVAKLETRDGKKDIDVPDAMIHHWVGTVLLTGATLPRAIEFVQAYDQYPARFGPTIQRARVLKHDGDRFEVAMRTWTKKVITVVIDADYVVDYRTVNPARIWTKSVATNVKEIQSAGEPGEKAVPGDSAGGYLWRLNNYCAFEERPEGTLEQCESISLTREPPFGLGWVVKPFITGIPRETLEFTLGRVRSGLMAAASK